MGRWCGHARLMLRMLTRAYAIDRVVGLITLLSLPLFFYGLNSTFLWQDEAQTALLGRSVMRYGVPMVGSGTESVSAIMGNDAGLFGIYFQISWLQAYVAAASFTLFGESSWSARVAFALAGWLCVPLTAWVAMRAAPFEGRAAARIAALLVATSVPFIVCARQARYYPLTSALVLAVVGTYAVLLRSAETRQPLRPAAFAFATAAIFLVLSFDVVAIGVLGAAALHWLAFRRRHSAELDASGSSGASASFWIAWGAAVILLAVWIAVSLSAPIRQTNAGLSSIPVRLRYGIPYYVGQIDAHVLPVLVGAPLLALSFGRRTRSAALLLTLFVVGGAAGAMLSPYRYFRYIVPVIPLIFAIAALGLTDLWQRGRWHKTVAALVIGAMISSTAPHVLSHSLMAAAAKASGLVLVRERPLQTRVPFADFLGELRDPPRGPIAAMVGYLRANAQAGDVLVTTYGELPLKFHTTLAVYGGETAQLPPSHVKPRWIWPRYRTRVFRAEQAAVMWVERELEVSTFERIELDAFDRRWENREDPEEHIFSNPGPPAPNVVIYRAVD